MHKTALFIFYDNYWLEKRLDLMLSAIFSVSITCNLGKTSQDIHIYTLFSTINLLYSFIHVFYIHFKPLFNQHYAIYRLLMQCTILKL